MELFVALAFFTLPAVLGRWVVVDSRVPGGCAHRSPEQDLAGPPWPIDDHSARKASPMNGHDSADLDDAPVRATMRRVDPNPYAITLAALVASAQVPLTEQIQEQPTAAFHDYSVGFHTATADIDGGGDDGE